MRIAMLKRFVDGADAEAKQRFATGFIRTLDKLGISPGGDFLVAHPSAADAVVTGCVYCGNEVDEATGYRAVKGWERIRRPASDTKAFHAPEKLAVTACSTCVSRITRGVAPGQTSLIA